MCIQCSDEQQLVFGHCFVLFQMLYLEQVKQVKTVKQYFRYGYIHSPSRETVTSLPSVNGNRLRKRVVIIIMAVAR